HQPVVIGVGGIVDPAVIRLQGGHREAALGTRDPVGPVEAVEQRKRALRARAVAFALVGPYAAAAADGARLAPRPGEPPGATTQRHRCRALRRIGHGRHYNGRQQKRSPRQVHAGKINPSLASPLPSWPGLARPSTKKNSWIPGPSPGMTA